MGEQHWRILARRTRIDLVRGILVVGLGSAAAVFFTARGPQEGFPGIPPEQSKSYLRTLEMVGGRANVVASDLMEGFKGLWQGRPLAFTLAALTVVLAFAAYWITEDAE